jgi:hypothetical protein
MAAPDHAGSTIPARPRLARAKGLRRTNGFLAALGLSAVLAGGALAATPERIVAQKQSMGGFAATKVSATVLKPATLRVRVTTVPRQNVLVSWTVVCSKSGTSAKKTKQVPPTLTPTTRSVPLTLRLPAKCTLSATAQLEHGEGRITVQLLARRR